MRSLSDAAQAQFAGRRRRRAAPRRSGLVAAVAASHLALLADEELLG